MLLVTVKNDGTGSPKKGNYYWTVRFSESIFASGVVQGHQKAKGWKKLLKKVTNAVMKAPEQVPEQLDLPAFTPDHAA